MRIRNSFGTEFSGTIGHEMIASSWKGHAYVKRYAVPRNPRTELQVRQRTVFADSVRAWHALSDPQKQLYRRLADGMTGFNLFVSRYVDAAWNGREPEVPVRLEVRTPDGGPIPDGSLIVRRGGQTLVHASLERGRAEIALTASDAPYTFVPRRGANEETVGTIQRVRGPAVPVVVRTEARPVVPETVAAR